MRFSWTWAQTWVFLRILGAVILFVLVALWFQEGKCPAHDPSGCPYSDDNRQQGWVGWMCRMTGDAEAVFALALVFCNALFFGYLSRQLAQTDEANRQTKRSVDVLLEIERGRLELDAMDLMVPAAPDNAAVVLGFRNSGKTGAVSIQRGLNVQFLEATDVIRDIPWGPSFTRIVERMPVPSGEGFGFRQPRTIEPEELNTDATKRIPNVMSGRLRLFVQGYIRYEVVTGVIVWNWFTYVYIPSVGRFAPDALCAFNGHGKEEDGHHPIVAGGDL